MKYRILVALVGAALMVGALARVQGQQTGAGAAKVGRTAFEESVRVRLADRRSKCMNAIGSVEFCSCLNGSLPLEVDFQRYIAVTISTSTLSQLPPEEKRMADRIIATRDVCVAKMFVASK